MHIGFFRLNNTWVSYHDNSICIEYDNGNYKYINIENLTCEQDVIDAIKKF